MGNQKSQSEILSEELLQAIREEVQKAVHQALQDPDAGKTLRDEFVERVKESRQSDSGDDLTLDEVKSRLDD